MAGTFYNIGTELDLINKIKNENKNALLKQKENGVLFRLPEAMG